MKKIQTNEAAAAIGPYSQGIALGGMVYTSGQIPINPESGEVEGADITGQTERVMKNLAAVLKAGGASMGSVVKTTCFLSDMGNFAAFNQVYAAHFGDHKPARSCVAVKDLPKGVLVEVEAIAAAV